MKLLKYLFISVLVFGITLISPARSQTPPRLPVDLSAALCMNNWDQALTLVQQMLNASTLSPTERSQLATLSTQIREYQRAETLIDQSEACETAIFPGWRSSHRYAQRSGDAPSANASSQVAENRRRRSIEEGDYRL